MWLHVLRRPGPASCLLIGICYLFTAPGLTAPKTPSSHGGQVIPADAKTVLKSVRKPGATAVLLNVWATWCEPCREEMPDIVRFYRENQQRGLRLVLVSGDSIEEKASVEKFLSEQGVHFPTFIKIGSDMDFIDGIDRRWNGDLPVSLLFDAQGNRVHFWSGKVAFEVLQQSFEHLIQTGAKGPKNRRLE